MSDPYHFSTAYDIGVIMAYAMKNDFCANILTTNNHQPTSNFRKDLKPFSSDLLCDYLANSTTQPSTAEILGGKTGWTGNDSGNCIVSYAKGKNGHEYILVTAKALTDSTTLGKIKATEDQIYIYNTYIKQ